MLCNGLSVLFRRSDWHESFSGSCSHETRPKVWCNLPDGLRELTRFRGKESVESREIVETIVQILPLGVRWRRFWKRFGTLNWTRFSERMQLRCHCFLNLVGNGAHLTGSQPLTSWIVISSGSFIHSRFPSSVSSRMNIRIATDFLHKPDKLPAYGTPIIGVG